MAGRRILLTGTSGLGVTHVLKQLKHHSTEPLRCCKAEKHFLAHVEKTHFVEYWSSDPATEAMIRALALPQEILLACWHEAFKELADAGFPHLDDTPNPETEPGDADIVLAAHMCFYHQQSREFVPLVDTNLLADQFKPDVIVTLVDDVEHMFKRLREPRQMYANHDYEGFGGVAQACRDLSHLVHWRASEIAFAKTFARFFRCDHFLLAVKHPVGTLAALLFQRDRPRAYVSHAISEPRRRLAAGDCATFKEFCALLERVSADLRARVVLFEPTAIDEFRFRHFVVKDSQGETSEPIPLPATTERWPLLAGGNGLLWSEVKDDNPVDPKGHFKAKQLDEFETAKKTLGKMDPRASRKTRPEKKAESVLRGLVAVENATHVVGSLVGEIGRSVTSRDLKLVEQADHLIVVRPLFNGNSSGGVEKEIRQHCRLSARKSGSRGGIWVFTAADDEIQWRRGQLANWLHRNQFQSIKEVKESEVRDAINSSEINVAVSATNPSELKRELTKQVDGWLDGLQKLALATWSVNIVPQTRGAGDYPLKPTTAVAALDTRAELKQQLLRNVTPTYLLEWEWFKEKLDHEVPLAIYWGDPWPRPQDLEDLYPVGVK